MVDVIITGGTVVTPGGVGEWDVAIEGERIAAVTERGVLSTEGTRVIDASGKIVVPGGVEPHAHIGGPRQPERSGAEPVSKAAIYGGTTTVLDFATQVPGPRPAPRPRRGRRTLAGQRLHRLLLPPDFHQRRRNRRHRPDTRADRGRIPQLQDIHHQHPPPSAAMQDNKTDFAGSRPSWTR